MTLTANGLWPLYAFVLGTVFGSFFTVVVYRVPLGLSIVKPGSFCPHCKVPIRWSDNLPVVGWLALRGKCRSCKTPIPIRYPLIELSCGAALAGAALIGMPVGKPLTSGELEWGLQLMLLVWASFPIVVTDFRSMLIPDVIVIPSLLIALALSFIPGGLLPSEALFGAVILSAGLWGFARLMSGILGKEAMGFGDVKLVAFFGAVMGVKNGLFAVMAGSLLGLLVMLPLQRFGKHKRGAELPFGPFLYAGAILAWFVGESFWVWYLPVSGGVG